MTNDIEFSTQDKILKAAKAVFFQKGFDGTRTRDIAKEANVNLAMLNYHFKSKKLLFEMVMMDALKNFIFIIKDVLNDPNTDFEKKLESIIAKYIDKFLEEPQLPYFVISQLHKSPETFVKITAQSNDVAGSVFLKQYQQGLVDGKYTTLNFVHILMNMGGLIIFPFLISPAIQKISNLSTIQMNELMEERKKLIFNWLKKMILK
jgi:AcrR family transcriptional regulator